MAEIATAFGITGQSLLAMQLLIIFDCSNYYAGITPMVAQGGVHIVKCPTLGALNIKPKLFPHN